MICEIQNSPFLFGKLVSVSVQFSVSYNFKIPIQHAKKINTGQILQQKSKRKRDYSMKTKELHGGIS